MSDIQLVQHLAHNPSSNEAVAWLRRILRVEKNRTEWHLGVWTPNSPEVRLFAMIAYIEEKEEPDPAMSCCPRRLEQLS